ncbi:NAD(P)-binding protein [Aspergillus avenaceus]|uniref:NmrA-like family domain-containing protein 1 n=1 Tax=Aspergillus avenaceus TaxID=36643 RepID=A0A5N6TSN1_ASPAV|nr:NAD(P)-binding protein [Aspergillus avenaceus]
MSKLITVFGATGNQGGSVINHILADALLSKEFKIRGITRDTNKPAAQDLQQRGVEVVTADLNSTSSLRTALEGSHTVFLVTNYWEYFSKETELQQGKNVADVSKELGVQHLIFSSLIHVTDSTAGKLSHVPHFDGKADIEKYIRASGVPSTFVLAGYFMNNYLQMFRKGDDGTFQLFYPVDGAKAKFPLFDAASDTGLFVKAVLKHASELNDGKQVLEAAGYYTAEEIVATFSEVTGKKAVFVPVSGEQYKAVLPPAVAQEFLENHLLIEEPGYFLGKSLDDSLKLLDEKPTSWADYVKKNISTWQ